MNKITTLSPIDGRVYCEVEQHDLTAVDHAIKLAKKAQPLWASLSIQARADKVRAMIDIMLSHKDKIAEEITWQMGRPISQTSGELNGLAERAFYMIDIAKEALKPYHPAEKAGFERSIESVPLGVVAVLSPWNYPLLTSVNAIVPALMAGNTVILKHSGQTPLIAEQYSRAAKSAGLPEGVFQHLHLNHQDSATLMADKRIDGVYFTGSVAGGKAVQQAIGDKFIPCGLELGGKDAAYVCADADIAFAAENLVDGAFFNSGQSCCSIERIYVHQEVYQDFVDQFVTQTKNYQLGNPTDSNTNLGPMVKSSAADFVREQINEALASGAKSLVDETLFPASKSGTPYLSPHVLVDVNHDMRVMNEESFGPVVGIMAVENDEQGIALVNDSDYGLTASIWSQDMNKSRKIAEQLEAGTVFLNRCDYLDPALAWTGYKDSGRGVTLSKLGYEHVTKAKSYHFRKP